MAAAAGIIDPTKTAKYPVVLSDALLGKAPKDVFTGIRCNHKPTLSSDDAPTHARLRPSIPGQKVNYDLSFADEDSRYAYAGTRTTDDNQYVLYFDPKRKVFVLDRVDSMFNMNLTRTPAITDPERLKNKYPQLDTTIKVDTRRTGDLQSPEKRPSAKPKTSPSFQSVGRAKKPEKRKDAKNTELLLPQPLKEKPKPRSRSPEEDEDSDDGDGGLLIEYPGGEPNRQSDFSPAFPTTINRRFSDFVRDSEADDADAEFDDDPEERELGSFKLPSPVNNHTKNTEVMDVDDGDADSDADADADFENDLEDDLEKELERELHQANSGQDADSESDVSEEE